MPAPLRIVSATIALVLFGIALSVVFTLWTANDSLASQESNPQCAYGTNALDVDNGDVRIIPTFHSLGVYWSPSNQSANDTAHVLFREVDSTSPKRQSLDLAYSPDDTEYRGSVVHLKSGTQYKITPVRNGVEQSPIVAQTWCEQFPIAETRFISNTAPLSISGVNGSPDGYILYTADPNGSNVIDGGTNSVVINNSTYVIVRGLVLKNAKTDAVVLEGKTHDIVLEENTIEGWGAVNRENGFGENDFAIGTNVNGNGSNFERLIIQRNTIRDPRADTNSWAEYRSDGWKCTDPSKPCHPKGPGGIFLRQTAGNHVIRYNEIYSTNGNYYNDAIGGGRNFSVIGNVHRDTDIYGNVLTQIWDDAIEAEGGNINVRIWGNNIDQTHVAIAISATLKGPVYVFRNVVGRTQYSPRHSNTSGTFMKAKTEGPEFGIGSYVFHNTTVGGVGNGIVGFGAPLVRFTSRNNIINAGKDFLNSEWVALNATNDFDYDLYRGALNEIDGQEQNGIEASAVYGNDPSRPYALAHGALGHDDGDPLPNFSDNAVGVPDMGAQEFGAAPLEFGVSAHLGQPDSGNSVPVADDDSYATEENVVLNVSAPGVLSGDSDGDGDPLTAVLDTMTSNGTLVLNADGSFTYDPDPGFNGSDSFTYFANDGTADFNTAMVTITVNSVDEELTVTDISPSSAQTSTTIQAIISGTGFASDAIVTFEQGDGPVPEVKGLTVDAPTMMTLSIATKRGGPVDPRHWDVVVTSGGSSVSLVGGLTILP